MIDTSSFLGDARCAFIAIDLQNAIAARDSAPHASRDVIARCAQMAQAFRARSYPVIYVRVTPSPDGGDALQPQVDVPPPPVVRDEHWATLVPECGVQAGDIIITKRQWGAFYGTELDLQLRRRGVQRIVIGGISTNIGVESTARDAFERGYPLLFVEDAMASFSADEHAHSVERIFPRIGIIRSTDQVLEAMRPVSANT
ncbi:MAG: hydrolase [Vulcanimicrobiaceae bacterium]